MSAERTKTQFADEIRKYYPSLDEQYVNYYAQKCIETQSKKNDD